MGDGDYIARVEACVTGLIGVEKCKAYPSGNYKPYGLLQEYGDDGSIYFGLMTGSFQKNKSGGTLRKNVGPITDGSTSRPTVPSRWRRATSSATSTHCVSAAIDHGGSCGPRLRTYNAGGQLLVGHQHLQQRQLYQLG